MEHDKMLTEEDKAILLQDELHHPPSSPTNEQQQQEGVMGHPVLPEAGLSVGKEAQKALEGLKGLRVDDENEKSGAKRKSGEEEAQEGEPGSSSGLSLRYCRSASVPNNSQTTTCGGT
jgi:hypothetical protein